MAGKDIIAMTQEELKRLHVIRKALDKSITQAEAAGIMGICLRQAQRIAMAVRLEGDKGVIHKSRRRPSNRALPDKIEDNVHAEKVTVEEKANGAIHITYRNTGLKFKEITTRPKKQEQVPQAPKKHYVPSRTAPWRRFRLPGSLNFEAREEVLAGAL